MHYEKSSTTNALIMPTAGAIFVADAHRGDGKRFVVRADEKLTAFLELESAIAGQGGMAF
jgi:hypothetical protein